jgi:hypothetical protein
MKFERLTIWACTETYGAKDGELSALDYVIPALDSLEGECKVLGYSTDDYALVYLRTRTRTPHKGGN